MVENINNLLLVFYCVIPKGKFLVVLLNWVNAGETCIFSSLGYGIDLGDGCVFLSVKAYLLCLYGAGHAFVSCSTITLGYHGIWRDSEVLLPSLQSQLGWRHRVPTPPGCGMKWGVRNLLLQFWGVGRRDTKKKKKKVSKLLLHAPKSSGLSAYHSRLNKNI